MAAVTLQQGIRHIPARIPQSAAVRGNVIYRADGEWRVVKVVSETPAWWMEQQKA